jgi:glutamate-1-semialdehyde 2,1-aminomutase
MTKQSKLLFDEALKVMPGGVNSPVRAFTDMGRHPIYFSEGHGAWLTDVDGKRYIDYVGSWGPAIAGHSNPYVISAIENQLKSGLSFGAPTELETKLAEKIIELIPSIEKIRMTSSGTEAAMSAIRLARGSTGREKIVKFEGCYHGHSDSLLVKAGSGALAMGVPSSPGVPKSLANLTVTLDFNNEQQVIEFFKKHGSEVAAIIVEPIAGNMGCILPRPEFLEILRHVTRESGSLLIFDEVMTGFRVASGGAQQLFGITPDLTVLGKIIGGGLPVGAVGGPASLINQFAPSGPIYQAGTLSGNPLAMASGLATLEIIADPAFHSKLNAMTNILCDKIQAVAEESGVSIVINKVCGMFSVFFSSNKTVETFSQVSACNSQNFNYFFSSMLDDGINIAPSRFEASFISSAHQESEIEITVKAAYKAFKSIRNKS